MSTYPEIDRIMARRFEALSDRLQLTVREGVDAVMEEVDRRAENWHALHDNTHQKRHHPQCPWCLNLESQP